MSEHHESAAKGPDGRMVDRMLFFSDAVFAIVLTIMVLDLHAPLIKVAGAAQSAAALWAALGDMGQTFWAYVMSFAFVGFWWTIHMRVTRSLHRFDWPTAATNLVFILIVTLIPFASSLIGQNPDNPAASVVYWGVDAATSFALTVLMIVSTRGEGRLIGGISKPERLSRIIQSAGPGVCFVAGAGLANTNHLDWAQWCWVAIIPIMRLSRIVAGKPAAPAAVAES
jgi:uncharacterized membrane protein